MDLTFVTGNAGKMHEAKALLGDLVTLHQDTGGYTEVQADTLEEVVRRGLYEVDRRLDNPFFLEDAGLFVDALSGFPGVYSAYAFKTIGWQGVLRLIAGLPEEKRSARFEAVVGYRDDRGVDHLFTGTAEGTLSADGRGDKGFGFDPIFIPRGHERTFGEMETDEKSALSHRGAAMGKLRHHLEKVLATA
ncbi:MAG: XTP/dITP diphosphatase [Euryarchaeota archaeon]|nr:XTP/dITP diphosphatase [Euryarchaeota archaeon]